MLAHFRRPNHDDTLAGIPHIEVELSVFCHKPMCQHFAVGHASLGKFAHDVAALITVFQKPDLRFGLERSDSLQNLEAC